MKKGRVFIPQEPMKKDGNGRWVSKGLNLQAATDYGEMIIVWPPDTTILTPDNITEDALRVAEGYRDWEDYIVAVGSPTLIGLLCWAIGSRGKEIRMLEWDRDLRRYCPTLTGATQKG